MGIPTLRGRPETFVNDNDVANDLSESTRSTGVLCPLYEEISVTITRNNNSIARKPLFRPSYMLGAKDCLYLL